jgi:HSP20 family protein
MTTTITNDENAACAQERRVLHPRWWTRRESDALVLELLLPGVKPEDLDLALENGVLRVRATGFRPELGEGERATRIEFAWGDWDASFRVPEDVDPDAIRARLVNGVLTLELPPRKPARTKIPVTPI